MDKYQTTGYRIRSFGGVHINSGSRILHSMYGFQYGSYAWEKAGRIWYAVLTDASLAQDAKLLM